MNPALHVAHYAMAWAAVRNNQATWDLIQTCNIVTVEPRVVIVCLTIAIGLGLYFWFKLGNFIPYNDEYRQKRINQISKSLKK